MLPITIALIGIIGSSPAKGTLPIVAWGVIAVAITAAAALEFLEVGYGEDRDRTRDSASSNPATPRPPPRRHPGRGSRAPETGVGGEESGDGPQATSLAEARSKDHPRSTRGMPRARYWSAGTAVATGGGRPSAAP
jgi:hypothetical protein